MQDFILKLIVDMADELKKFPLQLIWRHAVKGLRQVLLESEVTEQLYLSVF